MHDYDDTDFPETEWEMRLRKRLATPGWEDSFSICSHHIAPEQEMECSWDMVNQNVLVLGRIGKGKTFRVLAKVIIAAIAAANKTIVVMNPKGDRALMNLCRREAARAGLPFKVISTRPGRAANVCNLLYEAVLTGMTPDELAFAIGLAMGTIHPTRVYGAGFYSDQAAEVGMHYIRPEVFQDAPSWRHLALRLMAPKALYPEPDPRDIAQLRSIVTQLSFLSHLNALPRSVIGDDHSRGFPVSDKAWDNRVSMYDVVHGPPQVVYLDAPTRTNPGPSIITMQLFTSVFNHAVSSKEEEPDRLRYMFVIDEAKNWVTTAAVDALDMLRSAKVGTVLAMQNLAQLVFGTTDLRERVLSACNTHVCMSLSTRQEVEDLMSFGGTIDLVRESVSLSYDALGEFAGSSVSHSTSTEDRFPRNMALDIASREDMGFIRSTVDVPPFYGNGKALGAHFDFPISLAHFQHLKNTPWFPATEARPAVQGHDWLHSVLGARAAAWRQRAKGATRVFDD